MLSYRHAFHAGNFADVHKHCVLSVVVQRLLHKDAPICYLDTHAAVGRYDLQSAETQKNAEHRQGILRLWQQRDGIPAAVRPYLSAVQTVNPSDHAHTPRYYPGSPRIVRHFLRPQDRMILTELHPAEFQRLQQEFAGDRQTAVHRLDAYQGIKAFLPPRERRGLVLIDPPFERRDEPAHMIGGLQSAYKRWKQGVFLLWFPITHRSALTAHYRALEKTGIRKILSCELCVHPPATARRLNGSALAIINPPWQVDMSLRELQSWLANVLAADDEPASRVEWLIGE
jgi:23S rRNA (adenine2030-N6)-methyltransferase